MKRLVLLWAISTVICACGRAADDSAGHGGATQVEPRDMVIADSDVPASMAEASFHNLAVVKVLPSLQALAPGLASSDRAGVVVVDITVDRSGVVDSARVLQAPGSELGEAARQAALQWRVEPILAGANRIPVRVQTKLTFYFDVSERGRPTVSLAYPRDTTRHRFETTPGRDVRILAGVALEDELRRPGAVLIDTRSRDDFERDHRDMAVNIPIDELNARAERELLGGRVILECGFGATTRCEPALHILDDLDLELYAIAED